MSRKLSAMPVLRETDMLPIGLYICFKKTPVFDIGYEYPKAFNISVWYLVEVIVFYKLVPFYCSPMQRTKCRRHIV